MVKIFICLQKYFPEAPKKRIAVNPLHEFGQKNHSDYYTPFLLFLALRG